MKQLLSILIAIFLLSSCSIQQNLYFNKDGSGNLRMTMDANSILELAKMSGKLGNKKSFGPDSIKNENKQKIQDFIINNMDKMYLDFRLDIYDILPDSIKEIVKNPDDLKGYSIVVYNNKDISKIGINIDFKSIKDLDNKNKKLSELILEATKKSKENGNEKWRDIDLYSKSSKGVLNSEYSKYIKFRKGKITLLPNIKKPTNNEDQQAGIMQSMMQVKTIVHLPGKVKKSKNGGYNIVDKYTVELKDSKLKAINSGDSPVKIKYKRAWWDIF